MIHTNYPNMRGSFIHVPYIPAQVTSKPNMPSMSQTDITKGLALCIEAAVTHTEDYHLPAGYPAIASGEDIIIGEVCTLSNNKYLKSIDLLEGYTGEPSIDLYIREKKPVLLENGQKEMC